MIKNKPDEEEIKLEDLSKEEMVEAMTEPAQQPANSLEESSAELKAMGFPDISEINDKDVMNEALKNIQITKVLEDFKNPKNNISIRDFLDKHLRFLESISSGKSIKDLVETMTLEHAKAVIKTSLKIEGDDDLIKKHLKTLRKKYRK